MSASSQSEHSNSYSTHTHNSIVLECISLESNSSVSMSELLEYRRKTKWMLFSTRQMSQVHGLHATSVMLTCNGESLERVPTSRLLGISFNEHLTWNDHITSLLSLCYSALSMIKKLRNLAPFCVRKLLVQTLILSKLDYSCVVFFALPSYQLKRLQRVQNVTAGYVYGRYAKEEDCLSLWMVACYRKENYASTQYLI